MVKTAVIGNHDFYKSAPRVKIQHKNAQQKSAVLEAFELKNPNAAAIIKKGIVGDGVYEYELVSPFSRIRYRYEPDANLFYLDHIVTPDIENQGRGHAKALLESFFRLIKQYGGTLDCDTYTTSGMTKIKHVVEFFSKKYDVRLVRGSASDLQELVPNKTFGDEKDFTKESTINEDLYEYFYHATTPEALESILEKGLIPSEKTHWGGGLGKFSEGKVFVAKNFRRANYYGNIIWRNHPTRYRPILRFKYNKHRFVPDKEPQEDMYVEYPIKAKFDIFVYDENTKIDYNHRGDTFFKESTGHWRPLTRELASAIMSGEWDGEEIEDTDESLKDWNDKLFCFERRLEPYVSLRE